MTASAGTIPAGKRARASVLRPAGVDVLVPEQDPAGHRLGFGKTVLAEEFGDLEGARAAAAVDDDLGVLLAAQLRGDLRPLVAGKELVFVDDVSDGPLVRLADVDDDRLVARAIGVHRL